MFTVLSLIESPGEVEPLFEDLWWPDLIWETEEEAAEAGALHLESWPTDNLQVVEIEIGVCRHCDMAIHENPGWVKYKWIHTQTHARSCQRMLRGAIPHAKPKQGA